LRKDPSSIPGTLTCWLFWMYFLLSLCREATASFFVFPRYVYFPLLVCLRLWTRCDPPRECFLLVVSIFFFFPPHGDGRIRHRSLFPGIDHLLSFFPRGDLFFKLALLSLASPGRVLTPLDFRVLFPFSLVVCCPFQQWTPPFWICYLHWSNQRFSLRRFLCPDFLDVCLVWSFCFLPA